MLRRLGGVEFLLLVFEAVEALCSWELITASPPRALLSAAFSGCACGNDLRRQHIVMLCYDYGYTQEPNIAPC